VAVNDLRELADYSRTAFGLELDADACARIVRFLDLLEVWNRTQRLTGERDRRVLLGKHVADSLACASIPKAGERVLDIGTGAGFPGAVIACVRPDVDVTLLDSRERSISFLGEVIRSIQLPRVEAVTMRAEEAARTPSMAGSYGLVTSRAVRLDQVLPAAKSLISPGGRIVSMQAPKTTESMARSCADEAGVAFRELRDYHLPEGEPRRLVIFG
jgi:16S rRNA (guanine527-N7)-methyltransferase